MKTKTSLKTLQMVQTAILAAILIVMAFTPLGYFNLGPVSITFLMIPVVIGAIVVGPAAGAFLGLVFGITSFITAFSSPLGIVMLNVNVFYTLIVLLVPRVLMGLLVGLIFRAIAKIDKTKIVSFVIAALSGALINTILFVGALVLLFGSNGDFEKGIGMNIWVLVGLILSLNALIEAIVCTVAGAAIAKALKKYLIDPKEPKAPAAPAE